jgi:glycine/D-amino acid oxidase-like deaminating enzyme
MADRHYDAIVIGGGLLGSAVAYALSRNKKNSALLIDAREKGHEQGSSHGHSRIIRTVASESEQFGVMARESFRRMQKMNRPDRFVAGPVDALFMSFVASEEFMEMARKNDKPILNAADIFDRWGFQLPDAGVGIVDGFSGILDPSALLDIFYEEIGEENILWQTAVTTNIVSWYSLPDVGFLRTRRCQTTPWAKGQQVIPTTRRAASRSWLEKNDSPSPHFSLSAAVAYRQGKVNRLSPPLTARTVRLKKFA